MKNPPAFPQAPFKYGEDGRLLFHRESSTTAGMTLRDYFAAKAMQSALISFSCKGEEDSFAKGAYEMADAMLKAREQ